MQHALGRGIRVPHGDLAVTCPSCGGTELESFYTASNVPVSSCVLLTDLDSARNFATGSIDLVVCQACGFIHNHAFDPRLVDYSMPYEESQAASPTFQQFARRTIERLASSHGLAGKSVFEVGCGKAEWLALFCASVGATGVGIDPAYIAGRVDPVDSARLSVLTDYFDESKTHLTAPLIACRHTLEHVANTAEFMGWLARSTSHTPGSVLFLELPDSRRILADGAFWDVYYEHCSYFTDVSLSNLITSSGLGIADLRLDYGDQYLLVEATHQHPPRPHLDPRSVVDLSRSFQTNAADSLSRWREALERLGGAGRKVALWGASSKTVGFLSGLGHLEDMPISTVVDINPSKHHAFLPGSGMRVMPPDALAGSGVELIVSMNPIYNTEISGMMEHLGVVADLTGIDSPPV